MARSRQAFAQLKRSINTSGFVAAPGTPAGNYLAWLKNEREKGKQKTIRVSAKAKDRLQLALVPFSSGGGAISPTTIRQSGYITTHSASCVAPSLAAGATAPTEAARFGASQFSKAELGVEVPDATTQADAGFYSSQIILRASSKEDSAKSQKTSGITGRKYSYREAAVATVPFGRSAITPAENELQRYRVLSTKALIGVAATVRLSTSLNSEVIRSQRKGGVIT